MRKYKMTGTFSVFTIFLVSPSSLKRENRLSPFFFAPFQASKRPKPNGSWRIKQGGIFRFVQKIDNQ